MKTLEPLLIAILWALLSMFPAFGAEVNLNVVTADPDVRGVEARVRWLGETRTVPLESAGEGRWVATLSGEPVRYLPVELWVDGGTGGLARAYSGIEWVLGDPGRLSFSVERRFPAQASRLSAAEPAAQVSRKEATWVGLSLGWVLLCVLGIGLVARMRPKRDRDEQAGGRCLGSFAALPSAASPTGWRWVWWSIAAWLALAVLWTWPGLTAGDGLAVGRHFDLPGTLWAIDAAPRLLGGLRDPLTAWPLGGDYRRFDSFTLLPLASAFRTLGAARLHGILAPLGLGLSGLAAQGFARAVGARPPWDLLGGIFFALSGLAANALLEGHVYMVLDPWLPLFAWAWWRACGPRGRVLHGLLAGGFFLLTLLTSGYLGVSGAVLALAFLFSAVVNSGTRVWRPALAAALVVAVFCVPYLLLFLGPGGASLPLLDPRAIQLSSAHLASLAAATPEVDRTEHSMALALSGLMVGLLAAAPSLLSRRQRWQPLALGACAALLFAMGPSLAPGTHESWFPLPMSLLTALPGVSLLRFPVRLAWGALVCGSALAALAGSALEDRAGPRARLLIALAVVEAVVLVRLPWRQATISTQVPSAYSSVDGPVLDYYPEGLDSGGDLESWFTGLSCLYQIGHQQAVADDCVLTPVDTGPRHQLGRWLSARLLSGQADQARKGLSAMGFRGVAMHADLFSPGDLARLCSGLSSFGGKAVESTDGGERIIVFPVEASSMDPVVAYAERGSAVASAVGDPGLSGLPEVASLRVELVIPAARASEDYRLDLRTAQGTAIPLPVQNRGGVPDDLPGDRVWVGEYNLPLPGALSARLVVSHDKVETIAWQGPIRLMDPDDRLVLRQVSADPPVFRPAVTTPDAQDQPANRDSGLVAAVGWTLVLAAAAMLAAMRRWSLSPRRASEC